MNDAKPLYIFDLDGTLALTDHRQHYLEDKDDRTKWTRFFNACDKDAPNTPVIQLLHSLRLTSDILIFSGRSDSVRDKTVQWLADNTTLMTHEIEEILVMRADQDFTADDELKSAWYDAMIWDDQKRVVCVFDDRQKVVNMWRSKGIACCQVAPGDF